MSLSYYTSSSFLYAATTNVFNVIAILSAILFILDPILFLIHTTYKFYLSLYPPEPPSESGKSKGRDNAPKPPKERLVAKVAWWKWYLVAATIHLFDAWFFRTIIPFYERARALKELSGDNLQELADIARLLWGIVRGLSLIVIGMEIWEQRLVLKSTLGEDYKNPKWAFAASYLIAPAIVGVSLVPVAVYLALLAVWHSTGFFWSVVREAFTPDWRSGQDVFVKHATSTAVGVSTGTPIAPAKPLWKVW
jgi:magnesium-transporting ATPase (P-type)